MGHAQMSICRQYDKHKRSTAKFFLKKVLYSDCMWRHVFMNFLTFFTKSWTNIFAYVLYVQLFTSLRAPILFHTFLLTRLCCIYLASDPRTSAIFLNVLVFEFYIFLHSLLCSWEWQWQVLTFCKHNVTVLRITV